MFSTPKLYEHFNRKKGINFIALMLHLSLPLIFVSYTFILPPSLKLLTIQCSALIMRLRVCMYIYILYN